MKKVLLTLFVGTMMLSSCGLYRKYNSTSTIPSDVYGNVTMNTSGNIADTGWQEMFSDHQLQLLIQTALANNTEAKTAQKRIEQAEIGYRTAHLAFLPTLAFNPTAQTAKTGSESNYAFSLGVQASWELDIFGARILNARRKAKVGKLYAQDYEQAVHCRLIASVASLYYELLALDKQDIILQKMQVIYEQTYESAKTLFEVGIYNSPAVKQTQAKLEHIKIERIELQNAIRVAEHTLCELLDEPYHTIARGDLDATTMPSQIATGIPSDLLRLRPDVRVAERNIEMAFYDVQINKGALYPALNLTANGGWKRLADESMGNPKVWFIEGIGSLVQPIFMGGRLRANLKISKIEQQIAAEDFRKTVIKAGHEVTNALSKCQKSIDKEPHIQTQVAALDETVQANQELMNHGTSSYLEVLTSLEDLLTAQNALVKNKAEGLLGLVELYSALGGK